MVTVEDWITIRELTRHGQSVSAIARQTGHDRKTVRKVLTQEVPTLTRSEGRTRARKLDPFRAYLDERMSQGCLNGAVLLEELRQRGFTGKISIVREILTPRRRDERHQREATVRFETGPGQQGQMDWADFGRIWVPGEERWRKLFAFVFTLGYSRAQYVEFVLSCDMEHFLDGHLNAFAALGIPQTILYDNLKTGILGRQPDGTPLLPGRFLDFALASGFTPKFCPPYHPQTKGKVERAIGYLRQNFWVRVAHDVMTGQLDLAGLNGQVQVWVEQIANLRVHGTHGEVVAARYAAEKPLLGQLAGRPRYDTAYHSVRRVSRDGQLSYGGQLYQLPLAQALTTVEVSENLQGSVTVRTAEGRPVRAERLAATGRTALLEPAALTQPTPEVGSFLRLVYPQSPVVVTRDLAVYEEVAHASQSH